MPRVFGQLMRLRPVRRLSASRPVTHAGVDDEVLRRWTRGLRRPSIRRDLGKVLAGMHPRHTLAAADANRDFPRPVPIAWGDDYRLFPRRLGERLAADLPDAHLVTLPDCAAFAALDQPALLATLIGGHLNRRAAATPTGTQEQHWLSKGNQASAAAAPDPTARIAT